MTTLSSEIAKLINAANALGAPLFSLDRFLKAAEVLEAERASILQRHEAGEFSDESMFAAFVAPTQDVDADIETIKRASRAAWAFVAGRFLPDDLAAPMDGDLDGGLGSEINETLRAGLKVVEQRIGKL